MPILDVTVVLRPGESLPADLSRRLADAVAAVIGAAPGTVWVLLRGLPADAYAENACPAADTPRPAFIHLTRASAADPAERAAEAAALAACCAPLLDRSPAHVHLVYELPGAGRIAFGGQLRHA